MNLQFAIKIGITVALVLLASALAKRPGYMGALVASLPVTSLLVLGWLYVDTHDPRRVADTAMGIFWFVLGGLPFFVVLAVALRQGLHVGVSFAMAAAAGFAGVTLVQWLLSRAPQ
ncbi:MAG: DUF3147 family protein [Pseudomonadota bacterium]